MSGRPTGARTAGSVPLLWALVAILAAASAWRLTTSTWLHLTDAPRPPVQDRREHRFRNLTFSQTQRLLDGLLRRAYDARTPHDRAVAMARVAALQRERGLDEPAAVAAREATQLAGNDPQVRAILSNPLHLEELEPVK